MPILSVCILGVVPAKNVASVCPYTVYLYIVPFCFGLFRLEGSDQQSIAYIPGCLGSQVTPACEGPADRQWKGLAPRQSGGTAMFGVNVWRSIFSLFDTTCKNTWIDRKKSSHWISQNIIKPLLSPHQGDPGSRTSPCWSPGSSGGGTPQGSGVATLAADSQVRLWQGGFYWEWWDFDDLLYGDYIG